MRIYIIPKEWIKEHRMDAADAEACGLCPTVLHWELPTNQWGAADTSMASGFVLVKTYQHTPNEAHVPLTSQAVNRIRGALARGDELHYSGGPKAAQRYVFWAIEHIDGVCPHCSDQATMLGTEASMRDSMIGAV